MFRFSTIGVTRLFERGEGEGGPETRRGLEATFSILRGPGTWMRKPQIEIILWIIWKQRKSGMPPLQWRTRDLGQERRGPRIVGRLYTSNNTIGFEKLTKTLLAIYGPLSPEIALQILWIKSEFPIISLTPRSLRSWQICNVIHTQDLIGFYTWKRVYRIRMALFYCGNALER